MYECKVSNMNSNVISVFPLRFFNFTSSEFLYQYQNYYILVTENISIR